MVTGAFRERHQHLATVHRHRVERRLLEVQGHAAWEISRRLNNGGPIKKQKKTGTCLGMVLE